MFGVNHYYSHAAILSQAAGFVLPQRIRGEIQHSFWESDKDLSNLNPSKFSKKLFLWGGSFLSDNKKHLQRLGFEVIPIGDPFLYFLKITNMKAPVARYDLFLPKYINGLQIQDRIKRHERALSIIENISPASLKVRLHHKDYANTLIQNIYKKRGIEILPGGEPSSLSWMEEYINQLNTLGTIYSEHLGSHILRASAMGIKSQLIGDSMRESKLNSVFELYSSVANFSNQVEFARFQLGFNYVRSQEELRYVLELESQQRRFNKALIFPMFDLYCKLKSS